MGVIIEGKNILSYTLMLEWNKTQTLRASVTHALKCFFTAFSTSVTAGYAPTQPSSQDILTFFRLISRSPWLGWGSYLTTAQWGHDELSLSSTPGLCRGVVFSLCNVASSSLWISALQGDCHDPGSPPVLPKEVCEIIRTRKFCGTDWTNICQEPLRLHWSSVDMHALWRPIVIQTMPSEVPFRFHFLRFPDTCINR